MVAAFAADAPPPPVSRDLDRTGSSGVPLPPESKIARTLHAGEQHAYRIDLRAGDRIVVTAVQIGIDVGVTVYSPDGSLLADAQRTTDGPETALVVADTSGTHVLLVRAIVDEGPAGGYALSLSPASPATAADRLRAAAGLLIDQAVTLYGDATTETSRGAVALVDASLALSERAGDLKGQAEALILRGSLEQTLGEMRLSIETLNAALALARTAGDRHQEATAEQRLGLAYRRLGETDKAKAHLEQALDLMPTGGDRMVQVDTLTGLGVLQDAMGHKREALALFERVLPLYRELGSIAGEGSTYHNLGAIHWSLGERQAALDNFERALPLRLAANNPTGQARTLSNLGLLHNTSGEPQEALQCYREALAIWKRTGDRAGEASTLHNLGMVYADMGNPIQALALLGQALETRHALEDRRGEAITLNSIGTLQAGLGATQEALDTLGRALPLDRETRNRLGEAVALRGLGLLDERGGRLDEALQQYDQALAIARDIGSKLDAAATLRRIGGARMARGDTQGARAALEESLALSGEIEERNGEAEALYALARLDRDGGDLERARAEAESSVDRVETQRTRVLADALRSSYLASHQDEYALLTDVMMRQHEREPQAGHAAEALATSERARARGLLDLLAEGQADIRRGVDPDLLAREHTLQMEINSRESYRGRLRGTGAPTGDIAAVQSDVDRLLGEYATVRGMIRAASPRYAALTQPAALDLGALRRDLIDPGTVVLEYALGEERSYLWVIDAEGIDSHILPPRATIEEAARRLHDLLAEGPRRALEAPTRIAAADLSRILIGPTAGALGKRRLVFVPDGALYYVPFAALPDLRPSSGGESPPLIRDHEIVSLPSLSVALSLRQEDTTRRPPPGLVAILADPVLDAADPRLPGGIARAGQPPPADLLRSAGESGIDHLARLPYTRREAQAIRAAAAGGEVLTALDFDASRETATGGRIDAYRIVHFATHGLLNTRSPELSGIVLSLFDADGRPRDGFLRVQDLYNLELRAELVVLSSCSTALGQEVRGEGLLGLVRGFMYAGAPRVVASLWDVRDEATAELMTRFYRGMLRDGLRPAAALRAAQVSMLSDERWSQPHAWAGFTLQGEWW